MIEKWEIAPGRVHCVMRDAGANIKKALFLSDLNNLDCFAHQLQLVVKAGVTTQKSVSDLLTKCRSIATHFNHSAAAQEEFQERLNVPQLSVVQDVATRWNSSLHMLERTSQMKEAVCLYSANNNKIKPLSASDDDLLKKCVSLLKPFDDVTKDISAESSCVSETIPFVSTLKVMLSSTTEDDQGVKSMKASLLAELKSRFDRLQYNELYAISIILDPRYKGKFLEQHVQQKCISSLGHMCEKQKMMNQEGRKSREDTEQARKKQRLEETDEQCSSRSVSDTMSALLSSESDNEESDQANKETTEMIEKYLKLKRIPTSEDPLLWWSSNKDLFPELAELARSYLACSSSSVASERLFSGAGMIYDEKRSRLAPERAQKLLFLKHNLPIIDFKY